jgi:hypothetical protein
MRSGLLRMLSAVTVTVVTVVAVVVCGVAVRV